MENEEQLTKIEAARRQLRTAIELFFEDRDDVAVCSLAIAAHGILRGLVPQRGSMLHKYAASVGAEFKEDFDKYEAFYRQSDIDPGESVQHQPMFTIFWLLDCILMHWNLTTKMPPHHVAFQIWLAHMHPQLARREFVEYVERPQSSGRQAAKSVFLDGLRKGKFAIEIRPEPKEG